MKHAGQVGGLLNESRAMKRSGRRPDGSAINAVMPFESLKNLTDTDLDAMHAHFKTLPARATGNR